MVLCFQVYKISIGAACGLSWPSDRLVIQVLDDSTDPTIKVSIRISHSISFLLPKLASSSVSQYLCDMGRFEPLLH